MTDGNSSRSEAEYREIANESLEDISDAVEGACHDVDDFDIDLADGVLNIVLGGHGTFVINMQVTNKQIWLSSPISGPARYNYDPDSETWVNNRDPDCELLAILASELSELVGAEVELD